ncbi:type II toxin-antitoxin system SpoIISA family toxin [Rummeliibacillus sp. JY-2-4R]
MKKAYQWKIILKIAFPIIVLLIAFFIKENWVNQITEFISINKWFLLIGMTTIILYISFVFPDIFRKYKQSLRRTWYFFFIFGIVLILKNSGFEEDQWRRYVLLGGMFIFVDLALFITPNIKKIGGTEIENIHEVESINDEMKKVIIQTKSRSKHFTSILDRIATEPFGTQSWNDMEEYRVSLEDFLYIYGEKCRENISVLCKTDTNQFVTELGITLGLELGEEELSKLDDENIVLIDNYTVLIPFTKLIHPVVIAIVSQNEPILQIDFNHIINLTIIHSWYKKYD